MEELEHSTYEVDNLLYQARNTSSDIDIYALANQSLAIARDLRYDGGIVRASIMLAQVCARTNRTEEALQHFLEAEEKLNPSGASTPLVLNKPALLEVYGGLGDLFVGEKLYDIARKYYRQVLDLAPDDYPTMEKAADACLLDMRYDSAEVLYKGLIKYYQSGNNYPKLVLIYQKLANAYSNFGNPGKGLHYYRAVEDIIEHNGFPEERAVMYNNMGRQYAVLNDYKRALEYFRKADSSASISSAIISKLFTPISASPCTIPATPKPASNTCCAPAGCWKNKKTKPRWPAWSISSPTFISATAMCTMP